MIRAFGGMGAIPREGWNRLVGEAAPFLEWDWLELLERSGSAAPDRGWQPRHLVIEQGGRPVAACPAYLKAHSMGEFVYDWSWAHAARQLGVSYYPKLIAAVPFTPATGRRLLVAPDQDRGRRLAELVGALHAVARQAGASGVHVLFCGREEAAELEALGAALRLQHQYHWTNPGYRDFDDFLSRFRSRRRKAIRRERRGVADSGLAIERLEGAQITREVLLDFYPLYRDTCERYGGWDYLSRALWEGLADRWPDRLVLFSAYEGGPAGRRMVAGSLCVRKGRRLYGRYWGHLPGWEPPKYLHFELCLYAPIQYCIAEGIQRFEPGQGGEHKRARGFEPSLCYSAHWIGSPRLDGPVRDFLERERRAVRQRVSELIEDSPLRSGE